ncbi:DNA adenine methylase [Polynucleobacter sp. AM-25C3]|uniref:DNA adenine methylase n=1 Tax=Polynucleobacter sp. AM-25C3 TaxID=1855569 RepID=UPI001C0DCF6B|nr:DNA adenine methylase [Polynucleobacter sp. AM-25C3]MBU3600756.1 DNA adenine methylase [Polynucleobacter sp. AM-25C3]
MPITDTPLRYPGGKTQLLPLVIEILKKNDLIYGEYVEPFAGGSGIAVSLLLNDYVSQIYLNDLDYSIYAFWHSVIYESKELCRLIDKTEVTIDQWHRQKKILATPEKKSILEIGFATLFLNRTNRSGIIKGGVIGGLEQSGNYKLDCRFNKVDLIRKISRIALYGDRITLTMLDAEIFIKKNIPKTAKNSFINIDPPYFCKGSGLYTNFYKPADHASLAQGISKIKRKWMVTYDDVDEIRSLYSNFPMYTKNLQYSAQEKRIGVELLISSKELCI